MTCTVWKTVNIALEKKIGLVSQFSKIAGYKLNLLSIHSCFSLLPTNNYLAERNYKVILKVATVIKYLRLTLMK